MKKKSVKPWYEFKAEASPGVAELRIFGPIGGGFWLEEDDLTGKAISRQLEDLAEDVKTIRVFVNSPGGSVFDGVHIANALRRQREEHGRTVAVEIEALAASAATLITSAGTSIKMPRNALMMIHNPIGWAEGPRETMLKVAEGLERAGRAILATYRWVSKLKSKDLRALMDATTWMDADEALANGLITEIVDPVTAQASFDGAALAGVAVPDKYKDRVRALFKGCGCSGPTAGADFADLANGAIDQRIEDEDELERADVIAELVASTGETEETIEEILDGSLECPAAEIVAGFVEVLPITQDQADSALEADGCETETEDEDELEEEEEEEEETETEDSTAADPGADNSKARMGAGGKTKMKAKTNGDKVAILAARTAEKTRIGGINAAAEVAIKAGLSAEDAHKAAAEAIENDTKVDDFRASMFEGLATAGEKRGPKPIGGGPDIQAGEAEHEKRVKGISAALWKRAGVDTTIRNAAKAKPDHPAFQNLEFDPGEFRGLSLLEHARRDLARTRPGFGEGKNAMETAGAFLNAAGIGQTTSDFAIALENALNKTLLAAYAVAPETWRLFCKVGTVSDFRPHNRYQRGYLTRLQEIKESGEFKNKEIPDAAKEVQQALTYGNILVLSRQAIVNDDMGVFNDLAVTLGMAAGLSIELGVFDLLKENSGLGPTMVDTKTLFHADHGNINATGSALSVAGLDADRVVMATQTDSAGAVYLDLRPAALVLPIGLGGEARVINAAEFDHDGTKLQKPNKVRGLFRDIADSPHLTGTRRYMFADPTIAPVVEVAFLEGEQDPFMEMENGWRIDGVEWKIRHDFGIRAISYRGCVTNAGA